MRAVVLVRKCIKSNNMDKSDKLLLRLIGMGADKLSENAMFVIAGVMYLIGFILALML